MRIIVLVFFVLVAGCLGPHDENIQIHPRVKYQGNVLTISNYDNFAYYGVKLGLNNGTFKLDLSMPILAGQEFNCDLSDFVKSDGERFNVFRYKPTSLSVSCHVIQTDKKDRGSGEAFYYGKF